MNEKVKYLLIGLIGSLIGNGIIFFFIAWGSPKYGTLADWVSGLGTVAAIVFVYLQIDEQRREFNESKTAKLKIAFGQQPHMEKAEFGGRVFGKPDYYIWAVNDGMSVGSFKFLGFCRKDQFSKIDTNDVIFDPEHDGLQQLLPHSTNNFELLYPGQVSKERIVYSERVMERLNKPDDFYVIYMDAVGKIYKKEIRVSYSKDDS